MACLDYYSCSYTESFYGGICESFEFFSTPLVTYFWRIRQVDHLFSPDLLQKACPPECNNHLYSANGFFAGVPHADVHADRIAVRVDGLIKVSLQRDLAVAQQERFLRRGLRTSLAPSFGLFRARRGRGRRRRRGHLYHFDAHFHDVLTLQFLVRPFSCHRAGHPKKKRTHTCPNPSGKTVSKSILFCHRRIRPVGHSSWGTKGRVTRTVSRQVDTDRRQGCSAGYTAVYSV